MEAKILLVDDEKDFLEVMRERLEARGYSVATAISAAEALQMIKTDFFDAVILDLQMPGMDGLETLQQMKAKRPELQVILLTGHASVEKGVEAIKLGAMDFVEKPADLDSLGQKIEKAKEQKMLIVEKADQKRVLEALKRYGF
jgi:DNA-binding NtrC family response regulator